MVPQSSPPPSEPGHVLSPETMEHLRGVIAERWRSLEQSERQLHEAVRAAVAEAKTRELQPEQLILALKKIEADVFARPGSMRATDQGARDRFHQWLVTACLEAYFGRES